MGNFVTALFAVGLIYTNLHAEEDKVKWHQYTTPFSMRTYDSAGFHDFTFLSYGYFGNPKTTDHKIDLLGMGFGNRFIDIYSALSITSNNADGPGLIGPFSFGAGLLSAGIGYKLGCKDCMSYALIPTAVLLYSRAPEIRLLPIYPIQFIAGYDFDFYSKDHGSEFYPKLIARYGIGIYLKVARLKLYKTDQFLWRYRQSGFGIQLDMLVYDFESIMSM